MLTGCNDIISGRICPRCGRSNVSFVGALCSECFLEVYGVASIPGILDITYCRVCGSYKYQGQWVEGSGDVDETIREYALITLSQKLKPSMGIEETWVRDIVIQGRERGGLIELRVTVAGRTGSLEIIESKLVKVKAIATLCPSCMRKLSKTGYNAVIQVRPLIGDLTVDFKNRLERLLSKLEARVKDSIISIEDTRNGYDILVEDQNVAKMIANKIRSTFGGSITETFKVTGSKPGGGRKGILTLSVRVLNVKPGDLIAYTGAPHIVIGETSQGLRLINVNTGTIIEVSYDNLVGSRLLDSRGYSGGLLKRLKLLRIEGETIIFKDLDRGGESRVDVSKVVVLRGALELNGLYLAYQLRDKLYILGVSEVE